MSARSHPRWIVVTLATALVLPGAGASSAESRSSNPDGIFELNRALAYAALPQERCGGGSDLPALGDCLTPDEFVGSGTESIAGSEAVSAETFPGSGDKANGVEFELVPRFAIQTPRWYAALSPMSGDTFVRVHGFGDVAAVDADGFDVWNRPATSFFADWGVTSNSVPFVLLGASPVDPFLKVSERPYAVGDLTADGVADVAVAHLVANFDYDLCKCLRFLNSFVTVLDGGDGSTLWFRDYPGYVTQLVVTDGVLIIGNETGDPKPNTLLGRTGSTTALYGVSFGGSSLEAADLWAISTEKPWARWLAAEPAAPGRVAVAWTNKPIGQGGPGGRVILVDAVSGAVAWTRETAGYPRTLRFDVPRDQVVVHEEQDPAQPGGEDPDYSITGLHASDGSVAATVTREDAILMSFQVADVAGSPDPEWVVGDSLIIDTPLGQRSCGRVLARDPSAPEDLWSSPECPDPLETFLGTVHNSLRTPVFWPLGLMVSHGPAGPVVLVASISDTGGDTMIRALSGVDGSEVWRREENAPFPLYLAPQRFGGRSAALAASPRLALKGYDVLTGNLLLDAPLLNDVHVADAADVDGDGPSDLLLGTRSGGVFAIDGTSPEEPRTLWRASVDGAVHQIALADLDGDGADEVIVASSSSIRVLHLVDGSEKLRIEPFDGFVWTFALGDVAGNARPEIVVPTGSLAAFRGTDGRMLWEYRLPDDVQATFSTAAIVDRRAVAQYVVGRPPGVPQIPGHHQAVVAIDGPTGAVAWSRTQADRHYLGRLWRSVVAGHGLGGAPSGAVAVAYQVPSHPTSLNIGEYPQVDVYDITTGKVLWTARTSGQIQHHGLLEDQGDLLGLNGNGVARFAQGREGKGEVTEMELSQTLSAAVARLGSGDSVFIQTYDTGLRNAVVGFPKDAVSGPVVSRDDLPHSWWSGLSVGDVVARDLDGDGGDELIAHPHDWPAKIEVGRIERVPYVVAGFQALGLVVLEMREE